MKKQNIVYISLIFVLVFINMYLLSIVISSDAVPSIIGTYCNNDVKLPDAEYLVFEENFTYCKYKQFEILEKGTYIANEKGLEYTLYPEDREEMISLILSSDTIYVYDPVQRIMPFGRIDDKPMYINVPFPDVTNVLDIGYSD